MLFGAGGHFHGRLSDALENLGEVVEHVVIESVTFPSASLVTLPRCDKITSRDLVDGRSAFRNAALQLPLARHTWSEY